MFGPCRFDRGQHLIIHPPLEDWVKRQASPEEKSRIFVYHHLIEKTFVVGWWVHEGGGLFVDLCNLGDSLANFDRSDATAIQNTLRSNTTTKQVTDSLVDYEDNQTRTIQDDNEAMSERLLHRNPMVTI